MKSELEKPEGFFFNYRGLAMRINLPLCIDLSVLLNISKVFTYFPNSPKKQQQQKTKIKNKQIKTAKIKYPLEKKKHEKLSLTNKTWQPQKQIAE